MLHHQLAATGEQVGQSLSAGGPVERIGLVDLDSGQRAALFAQSFAGACQLLLMRQVSFAGFDPFFA